MHEQPSSSASRPAYGIRTDAKTRVRTLHFAASPIDFWGGTGVDFRDSAGGGREVTECRMRESASRVAIASSDRSERAAWEAFGEPFISSSTRRSPSSSSTPRGLVLKERRNAF